MTKLTLQPGTFTYNKDDDDLARTVPVAHILLDGKDFIKQIRTWTHGKHLSPLEPAILYDMLHHEWTWSRLSMLEDGINGRTKLFRMNPIIFDKTAYFAELAAMKRWMVENNLTE